MRRKVETARPAAADPGWPDCDCGSVWPPPPEENDPRQVSPKADDHLDSCPRGVFLRERQAGFEDAVSRRLEEAIAAEAVPELAPLLDRRVSVNIKTGAEVAEGLKPDVKYLVILIER